MKTLFKRIEIINLTDDEIDKITDTLLRHKVRYGTPNFNWNRDKAIVTIDNITADEWKALLKPFSWNGYEYDLITPSVECRV